MGGYLIGNPAVRSYICFFAFFVISIVIVTMGVEPPALIVVVLAVAVVLPLRCFRSQTFILRMSNGTLTI